MVETYIYLRASAIEYNRIAQTTNERGSLKQFGLKSLSEFLNKGFRVIISPKHILGYITESSLNLDIDAWDGVNWNEIINDKDLLNQYLKNMKRLNGEYSSIVTRNRRGEIFDIEVSERDYW